MLKMVPRVGKVKSQKSAKTIRLDFSGPLTVKNAAELKDVLLSTLDEEETMIINLAEVTEIDLSSLQLLCSVHQYALKNGKEISLNDPEENLLSAGKVAGFHSGKKCRYEKNNGCLWRFEQ